MTDRKKLTETIEELVTGRDYVTYDELLALLPEVEENIEFLEALLEELSEMGIMVLDRQEAEEREKKAESEAEEEDTTQERSNVDNIPADDLLSVYLSQMGQEPLLTFEEEVELAQQIERGRQAEEAIQETDYTAEEYARLQAQVQAGKAAREHLGRANTRLVVSIAKKYRGNGVSFPDLIQNGNVGLMRAVDRYDYRTGNRFSTYATWWIRQAVTRALANQGRIIRIPVHTGDRMRKMGRIAQRLQMEFGRRPTPTEIAEEMDESPFKVRQMMRWASRPLSLEQPAGREKDVELGHFVEDAKIEQPEDVADRHILNETIDTLLSHLKPREARILRLRYGLKDGRTRTLSEVAKKFGLSRERIRQIEREALLKLRLAAPDYQLDEFLKER